MKNRITVEHFETFNELTGIAYMNENYDEALKFSVQMDKLEAWLNEKGLVGLVTVTCLDSDGEPSDYESIVTLREYLCESFDEFVLSEYLNEHQDSILAS